MDELPDEIFDKVTDLSNLGNEKLENGHPEQAVSIWKSALDLLPAPKHTWEAAMWLYASIGDVYREQGKLEDALWAFRAANTSGEGHANPFVQYSLGATLYDLQREDEATDPLLRAYMMEGVEIFDVDTSPYLQHLKAKNLIAD